MRFAALEELGRAAILLTAEFGRLASFAARVVRSTVTRPLRIGSFIDELYKLGVLSVLLICVSGLAVGMVLALQGYKSLVRFGAEQSLGALVGLSLVRELGPVLTALLVTGRAGSSVAAEIGSMVATEQLDGLRMMSIEPIGFVVRPKALAMLVVMPMLTALFIVSGLAGAYFVGVKRMGVDGGWFVSGFRSAVDFHDDVLQALVKSLAFGALAGLIATYRGFTSAPTSEGVSAATTSTVVVGSVSLLVLDYALTALWGVGR